MGSWLVRLQLYPFKQYSLEFLLVLCSAECCQVLGDTHCREHAGPPSARSGQAGFAVGRDER